MKKLIVLNKGICASICGLILILSVLPVDRSSTEDNISAVEAKSHKKK